MSRTLVLVGTRKGAWIYSSNDRRNWVVSQPMLPGWSFYGLSADLRRDPPRLYAAANHWAWGRSVAKSDDFGQTWDYRSTGLAFPPDMTSPSKHPVGEWVQAAPGTIGNIWSVTPGHDNEPGVVFVATQPAGLFRSEDWGASWTPVESLNRHENRQYWSGSGGGDSNVHSVQIDPRDPRHIYLCVSSGCSYQSRNGGETWEMFSHNAIPEHPGALAFIAQFADQMTVPLPPGKDPAGLDELHAMRLDVKQPGRIWAQAHWGVFRSDDDGATWADVTKGLPSFHGFPIAVTKAGADAVYVVPLDYGQDNFRVVPGQFTVYRTEDTGASWQPLTNGLPGPDDYQSVYREAMDTDALDPAGVYVGTTNGGVYASADRGDSWVRLPGTLPPILSVTAAVID